MLVLLPSGILFFAESIPPVLDLANKEESGKFVSLVVVNMLAVIRGVSFSTVLIANTPLLARSYRVAGSCYRDL